VVLSSRIGIFARDHRTAVINFSGNIVCALPAIWLATGIGMDINPILRTRRNRLMDTAITNCVTNAQVHGQPLFAQVMRVIITSKLYSP
jgi:hypothetical protein